MSVWSITKSPHGNHSESAHRTTTEENYSSQCTVKQRNLSHTKTNLFISCLPLFCEESGSKRDSNNCTERALELPSTELQMIICVCICVGKRMYCMCVCYMDTRTYIHWPTGHCKITNTWHLTQKWVGTFIPSFFHVYILIIKSCSCPSLNYLCCVYHCFI